jgi:hypothetical protein
MKVRCLEHVTLIRDVINAYKNFHGEPKEKRLFRKPKCRRKDNIEIDL